MAACEVLRIASHFVEAQISVAIFADDGRLEEVLAVVAPPGIPAVSGIGRGVGHAGPRVVLRRQAVLKLVVDEVLEKGDGIGIARVRVKPLHEALDHGAEVSGGVGPVPFRLHLEGGAVEFEAAKKVVIALAVVLVPQNAPLGEEVGAIGVTRVVRHGPWK